MMLVFFWPFLEVVVLVVGVMSAMWLLIIGSGGSAFGGGGAISMSAVVLSLSGILSSWVGVVLGGARGGEDRSINYLHFLHCVLVLEESGHLPGLPLDRSCG